MGLGWIRLMVWREKSRFKDIRLALGIHVGVDVVGSGIR